MHTYCLKEDKIPKEIEVKDMEEELKNRGFLVASVIRMKYFKEELPGNGKYRKE